jgi:hypothetical protein
MTLPLTFKSEPHKGTIYSAERSGPDELWSWSAMPAQGGDDYPMEWFRVPETVRKAAREHFRWKQ